MKCVIKKNNIMDKNVPLSEYNKILIGHIVPMAPFTPKSTSKLRAALHFRYSIVIPRFIPPQILLNPNDHYNHGFHHTFYNNHISNSD